MASRSGQSAGNDVELVGAGHRRERLQRHRDQRGVRDPGAVVAVADLALLVGGDAVEGGGVGGFVVLDRDRRRHPAHRMRPAAVAGGDQAQRISREEGAIHGHRRAVGDEPLGRPAEALDEAEDIVPAAAIEPDDMVLSANSISSISNAAGSVSISRVTRTVPRGRPSSLFGEGDHLAPPRRLARRPRAWADNNKGPTRPRSRPRHCGTGRARNRTATPTAARRRP